MRRLYENKTVGNVGEVGTILYWDGYTLNKIHYTEWSSSYGIPVAVCVIPSSHNVYGNGKAGWIAVHGVNAVGSHADREQTHLLLLGDIEVTNFDKIPTWNNDGQPSTTDANYGYLPSDNITDPSMTPCNGDESARYYYSR